MSFLFFQKITHLLPDIHSNLKNPECRFHWQETTILDCLYTGYKYLTWGERYLTDLPWGESAKISLLNLLLDQYIANSEQAWWNVITYMWYVDISTNTNKDILNTDSNTDSFFSNLTGHQEIRAYVFYILKKTFIRHSSFRHRGVVDSIHLKNRFYLNRNRNILTLIFA